VSTVSVANNHSSNKAWLRALELTAPIIKNPRRLLPGVIVQAAERSGDAPALLSDSECLTYNGLAKRINQYSRWVLSQGVTKGDVVCLLMPNRPEYLAIWLGITQAGAIVSLLNTNLTGRSLAHCINLVAPKLIIFDAQYMVEVTAAVLDLRAETKIWCYGAPGSEFPRLDRDVRTHSGEVLSETEHPPVSIHDTALCIYTSGTTGLPKAANVSHFRVMQWSHWFAGAMDAGSADRMYNCLPMYHSVGGVVAAGALLIGGGSVVLREKFSLRHFWSDIVKWDCTLFQYIGELCRYLLHAPTTPYEVLHKVRMCCGNGLRKDIWNDFQKRFEIPQVLEFYASTEGTFSLFNIEGKPGAIGRIPPFLSHRFPVVLVKFDYEKQQPFRNREGFCVLSDPHEVGEALGKLSARESGITGRFEGYTSAEESEKKILRNVFETGDCWYRTGDLMRKDKKGYFYFIDRVGDTYRWKGENVAASEVSEAICTFRGIKAANVYGVPVPNTDGRAGMAAVVTDDEFDISGFRAHLIERLPQYAVPLFIRIQHDLDVTSTLKYTKTDLVSEGYDPSIGIDRFYFNDAAQKAFVPLDQTLFDRIQAGRIRL
jgi:fatty-acyl-CoA synthase